MDRYLSRRAFLVAAPGVGLLSRTRSSSDQAAGASPAGTPAPPAGGPPPVAEVPASFPSQDPTLVREMVTVAHGNVARVRELVTARPALANAAWDWGYGDWEDALGAASHVGNREIAELLIANGARPTIFSAAMFGQLDVVKMFITAAPGVQRIHGPHGITLLAHARAGGAAASEVVRYLESVGDADTRYPTQPITDGDLATLVGSYGFGSASIDRMHVAKNARGGLTMKREGATERGLTHLGDRTFHPVGAPAVRIRFQMDGDKAAGVVVQDGDVTVSARRVAG